MQDFFLHFGSLFCVSTPRKTTLPGLFFGFASDDGRQARNCVNDDRSERQKFHAFKHNLVDYFVFDRIIYNLSVALRADYA